MTVSKKQQLIMSIVWILIFLPSIYIAYTYFPSRELDWTNIIILFVIMFLTMLLPLQFKTVTISLERWITIVIFLQFGVFAEFVFVQLAVFILIFTEKSALPSSHKFFVNSTIFAVVSIASGFVFHYAGGVIGTLDFSNILFFGLLYGITYTVLNNVLLKVYFHLNWRVYSLFSKGAIWDYTSTIILLPFSISLYFLNQHLGNKSIMLVGIPFLIVLLVLRMYNNSNNLNDQLAHAGKIGRELAERLLFDEVIQNFLEMMRDVVPYEYAYIVDIKGEQKLIPLMVSESGMVMKDVNSIIFSEDKNQDDGLDSVSSRIYFNKKEVSSLKNITFTHKVASVFTAPIIRDGKTEGFLIMTSGRKNTFHIDDMKIVDILTGYFSISLEKARYYESSIEKSERCGLTKLYNYGYLITKLNSEMLAYHNGNIQELSVIILDIDHFKKVNDTYGHESGNDILIKLAELLKNLMMPSDIVARYGGEEFVIVLPDYSKERARHLAETIRLEVEGTIFQIIPDLSDSRIPIDVSITVSLGVATVPEDAEDTKDLLRNADRALYIGGKQAGRNRVGLYQSDEVMV